MQILKVESEKMNLRLSEKEGFESKTFVVTGGLGFVGSALCLELVRRGAGQVRAFDRRAESPWSDDLCSRGVVCIQGDVCKKQDVLKALNGAECVFHVASYGMSGREVAEHRRINEININGTSHILDACVEHGVRRLVYVSTCNVVFAGKEIVNGNESLPYNNDVHADPYTRSKSIAEQLVLKNNGRSFKDKSGKLCTCAIRPVGIYGPGEERHLPRIIKVAKLGLLPFKIGAPDIKTDWVYVDNLVLALLLASIALSDHAPQRLAHPLPLPVAAGQAYFISDGYPVNSFEFMRPLLTSLDYDMPKLWLSVPHVILLAKFFWALYSLLQYPWLTQGWLPPPVLLPSEIYKVGVTHYFSCKKAEEELGYRPMVSPEEGMAATIAYWKDRKRQMLDGPPLYVWVLAVLGIILVLCSAVLPNVGPVPLLRGVGLFFLRSKQVATIALLSCVAANVSESVYAWQLARKVDPGNATAWGLQTLALGYFSLYYLLKKAHYYK